MAKEIVHSGFRNYIYIEANKLCLENQQQDFDEYQIQIEIYTRRAKQNDRILNQHLQRTTEFRICGVQPTHGQLRHDGIKTEYKTVSYQEDKHRI